jgi:hypothetical protein
VNKPAAMPKNSPARKPSPIPTSSAKVARDRMLFDALVAHMRGIEPELRVGAMFGSPAAFMGKRMAFCVFESGVGAKVPEADAARLIASGTATPFRPYGKPAMKEWIELQAGRADVPRLVPVLSLALQFAKNSA